MRQFRDAVWPREDVPRQRQSLTKSTDRIRVGALCPSLLLLAILRLVARRALALALALLALQALRGDGAGSGRCVLLDQVIGFHGVGKALNILHLTHARQGRGKGEVRGRAGERISHT